MRKTKKQLKAIIEFHKRFAGGEQYLELNKTNYSITEGYKQFYWQQREVYNHIESILNCIRVKVLNHNINFTEQQFDEYFYSENGLVSLLVPVQRAYNAVKNAKQEFINRLSYSNILVEDGSVDIEVLEEEGLGAGKVLVYRQGANVPQFVYEDVEKYKCYETEIDRLLKEFNIIVGDIDFRVFMFENWLKENNND